MQTVSPGLLERAHEQEVLSAALARAAQREAGFVVLEGDPGLGKSSLLEWAAEHGLNQGVTVLRGRGGVLERTLGWGVARQLFENVVAGAAPSTRRRLLSGSASLAGPLVGLPGQAEQQRAPIRDLHHEHGLYWLVCNLVSARPALLLIDDAQWCDVATLGWLLYLARRSEGLCLTVVVAFRTGEPHEASTDLMQLIAAEPLCHTQTLRPLSSAATTELIAETYGEPVDPTFAAACQARTEGNPLFIKELSRELARDGIAPEASAAERVQTITPKGVSRVMMLRLARLARPTLELARAVAVLESAADPRIAFELAELRPRNGREALDELISARVLSVGRPLAFVHPLVKSVTYDEIPAGAQAELHARAARLLDDAGADIGLIATQLLRSDPAGDVWAVRQLQSAAVRELSRGSPAAAAPLLHRAIEERPDDELLAELLHLLGTALALVGDPESIDTLRRALSAGLDPGRRLQTVVLLGRMLGAQGEAEEAVEVLRDAAEEIAWEFDAPLRLRLEAALVNAARVDARTVAVIPERLRVAAGYMDADEHGGRLIAAQLSWGLAAIGAPASRTVEMARRSLAGGALLDETLITPEAYLGAVQMLNLSDELDEADARLARVIELAQQSGSAANFAAASCFRAYTRYLQGRLADAELCARDALRTAAELQIQALALVDGLATAYLALALLERGDVNGAAQALAAGPVALEEARETWATELMYARAQVERAQGRPEAAAELRLACGRRCIRWGVTNPAWLPWRSQAAHVLNGLGDRAQAEELCEEEVKLAHRFGAARPLGIALREQGLVQRGVEGLVLLEQSAETLAASPSRLEHARTLVALGRALRQSRRRNDARAPLHDGLALAERCGAAPLAQLASDELAAIGSRPRSVLRSGAESLTASERRVCQLAAAGRTNPEIAQLLFVTRATVESHLHSAYLRLGISSRKQLAAVLSEPAQ